MRDIQQLMKMAGAEDPGAALVQERIRVREAVAGHRAKTSCVTRISNAPDAVTPEINEDDNKVQRIFRHRQPQDHVAALAGGAPGPLAGTSGRGTFRSEAGF